MRVDLVYPALGPRTRARHQIIAWVKWPFLVAALASTVVNIVVGGRAWSVVVLWGLWVVWSFTLAPGLIDVNRISQFVKLVADVVVLLVLIDLLLAPGWAMTVVPIVCFSALIVVGALFFTDFRRQRHNVMPMLTLAALSLVFAVTGLIAWSGPTRWPLIVMASVAFGLLAAAVVALGAGFFAGVRKYFHT
ncbi:MAG: DUF6320 domain-containing protein [Propionibacteriaceae bacterium]|jgi:hypothetical protein|nr:DUF6320 domain-containing protein [Propionibacteriaceae bacterium]